MFVAARAKVVIAAGLAALSLVACLTPSQPTPTPTPTRVPRPTFTSTPLVAPTATRPPTPSPIATPTSLPTATPVPPTPTPDPNINPLTGLRVSDPTLLTKRALHVCIDNHPASRPQLGLDRADIVYEYMMERFYVTRFTGVFWGQTADRIGPIRSARLVNMTLAPQYDALLACSGASNPTRFMLLGDERTKPELPYAYLDIDLFDPQWNRYATPYGKNPVHNTTLLQVSTTSLRKWLQDTQSPSALAAITDKAWMRDWLRQVNGEKKVKLTGFTFSAPGAATPTAMPATSITIPYPQECCGVQWTYDKASGHYLRSMAGEPHRDGVSKEQLSAANVIVVYAAHEPTDIVEDETGATAIRIVLTGEGKASVFRDGVAIAAIWKRPGVSDFMQIVDAQGKPVPLHVGNSWIEIVPDVDFTVTFK